MLHNNYVMGNTHTRTWFSTPDYQFYLSTHKPLTTHIFSIFAPWQLEEWCHFVTYLWPLCYTGLMLIMSLLLVMTEWLSFGANLIHEPLNDISHKLCLKTCQTLPKMSLLWNHEFGWSQWQPKSVWQNDSYKLLLQLVLFFCCLFFFSVVNPG